MSEQALRQTVRAYNKACRDYAALQVRRDRAHRRCLGLDDRMAAVAQANLVRYVDLTGHYRSRVRFDLKGFPVIT